MTLTTLLVLWFYNLKVGRPIADVARELRAILASQRPAVLGMCEANGYDLPRIAGYTLVRDRSSMSRANLAAYVRSDLEHRARYVDLRRKWWRTKHPGLHPARSILIIRIGWFRVLVVHQAPKRARGSLEAQLEGITALVRIMRRWVRTNRPQVAMGDFNRRADEDGPGPSTLRFALRETGRYAVVASSRIDTAVIAGEATFVGCEHFDHVGGFKLGSDHEAMRLTVTAPLTRPRRRQ